MSQGLYCHRQSGFVSSIHIVRAALLCLLPSLPLLPEEPFTFLPQIEVELAGEEPELGHGEDALGPAGGRGGGRGREPREGGGGGRRVLGQDVLMMKKKSLRRHFVFVFMAN